MTDWEELWGCWCNEKVEEIHSLIDSIQGGRQMEERKGRGGMVWLEGKTEENTRISKGEDRQRDSNETVHCCAIGDNQGMVIKENLAQSYCTVSLAHKSNNGNTHLTTLCLCLTKNDTSNWDSRDLWTEMGRISDSFQSERVEIDCLKREENRGWIR